MWPFNKFNKITREEVVSSICQLEQEIKVIEDGLGEKQSQIDELIGKGKAEKSKDVKIFYAKKINALKAERAQNVQRAMYLMYNVQLLNKLKNAIDDKQFFNSSSKVPLNKLLGDQKNLAKFLNKALGNRIKAEDVLTSADETFRAVEDSYEQNDTIYGVNNQDDELLAMFEIEEQVQNEQEMFSEEKESKTNNEG